MPDNQGVTRILGYYKPTFSNVKKIYPFWWFI